MGVVFSFGSRTSGLVSDSNQWQSLRGLSWEGNNGSACVLIHGLTGTPNEMKYLGNYLNRKGYSVICPRLAYHGAPLEVLKYATWQSFYESVRRVVLDVSEKYNSVFVGGLSMGALLSLLVAEEFPAIVSGVTCLSPTLFFDGWNAPKLRWLLPLVYITPLKHFFYFKEEPPYGIKNPIIRGYVERYYSQAKLSDITGVDDYGYPFFPVTLLHQLHRIVQQLVPRLKEIRTPVLLIQAREDDMTSVKNSQFIYERINSQEKELVFLENSYHVITADQERNTVAQKMEHFYGDILRSSKGGRHAG